MTFIYEVIKQDKYLYTHNITPVYPKGVGIQGIRNETLNLSTFRDHGYGLL